ncbi:MAG: serine hydrolase [Deltaproteobacteria bacterium]|nr:serine hydrolase [Deltaproteobacteria bacterium]
MPCPACPALAPKGRGPFPVGDPVTEGLDATRLQSLLAEAEAQKSSAVLILKNGKLVVERYWGVDGREPLITMSISKSIVALAIGQLIAAKKIASLDQKVANFIPTWAKAATSKDPRQAQKAEITLRQILNHTSGLSGRRTHRTRGRLRRHARRTRVVTAPGTRFHYNNNAVDFLALLVQRVTGQFLDDYLQIHLFGPLDISGAYWYKYADGQPRVAGELLIRPIDLLKIGSMMLHHGRWRGEEIVPRSWVSKIVRPGQKIYITYGLLWWRDGRFLPKLDERVLAVWKSGGVSASTIASARGLLGKRYRNSDVYLGALRKRVGSAAYKALRKVAKHGSLTLYGLVQRGKLKGFSARGSYGQHLIIMPSERLVALRMRLPKKAEYRRWREENTYPDFRERVLKLSRPRKR